jgi:hypothetical protein
VKPTENPLLTDVLRWASAPDFSDNFDSEDFNWLYYQSPNYGENGTEWVPSGRLSYYMHDSSAGPADADQLLMARPYVFEGNYLAEMTFYPVEMQDGAYGLSLSSEDWSTIYELRVDETNKRWYCYVHTDYGWVIKQDGYFYGGDESGTFPRKVGVLVQDHHFAFLIDHAIVIELDSAEPLTGFVPVPLLARNKHKNVRVEIDDLTVWYLDKNAGVIVSPR